MQTEQINNILKRKYKEKNINLDKLSKTEKALHIILNLEEK